MKLAAGFSLLTDDWHLNLTFQLKSQLLIPGSQVEDRGKVLQGTRWPLQLVSAFPKQKGSYIFKTTYLALQ
jgi:hypothetical protein